MREQGAARSRGVLRAKASRDQDRLTDSLVDVAEPPRLRLRQLGVRQELLDRNRGGGQEGLERRGLERTALVLCLRKTDRHPPSEREQSTAKVPKVTCLVAASLGLLQRGFDFDDGLGELVRELRQV